MRIALVTHRYDAAEGTGGYVTRLLPRVARRHEVTLYASDVVTPVPDGVRTVMVSTPRQPTSLRIVAFPRAFERVRGVHDLVHAQGWVTRSAHVVTAHIVLAAWRAAARPAGALSPGERLVGGWVARREARLLRAAGRVIAPSDAARDAIARWYGRRDGVAVIPHGFSQPNAATRDRAAFGLPADAYVALYVGDARKGLRPAMRAAASAGVWLLVASHSPAGPYRREAEALGLTPRLRWAGAVADIASAYAVADVLLHPTIYDTFGLVVAEAMAAGLPVVVSRGAGIAELIADGVSGLLADNADDAAAALGRLRSDAALARRLADGGRAVAATHTWDRVAERTLDLYDQVAAR